MNNCEHGVNAKYCIACKKKRDTPKEQSTGELTEKQIENWRMVLHGMFGPYAAIMPVSQILAYRNKMQLEIEELIEVE